MAVDVEMQPSSSKNNIIASGGQGHVSFGEITLPSAKKTIECRNEEERGRAEREVTILQRLRNRNIVLYYGHTWDNKTRIMSIDMELCGPSLRHYIKDKDCVFDEKVRVSFFHDVLSALEYLKRERVLHRDIKPENIVVTKAAPLIGCAKLCDFGISKEKVTGAITQNSMMYTEGYLAPEVHFSGKFSYASDLFSAGVTFWEIINMRSAEYFKREHLKEDGPVLESLVYKCTTEAADSRIKVEDALRLISHEKQKVVGKEPVDFGRLFPKHKIVSAPDLSQGTAEEHPILNKAKSFSPQTESSTIVEPKLNPLFLSRRHQASPSGSEKVDLGRLSTEGTIRLSQKLDYAQTTCSKSGEACDAQSTREDKQIGIQMENHLKYTDNENYFRLLPRGLRQIVLSLFITVFSLCYITGIPNTSIVWAGIILANHAWLSCLCTLHPVFHLWTLFAEVHASVVLFTGATLFVGNVLLFGMFTISIFLSLIFPPILVLIFICYILLAIILGTQFIFLALLALSSVFLYVTFWKHILGSTS